MPFFFSEWLGRSSGTPLSSPSTFAPIELATQRNGPQKKTHRKCAQVVDPQTFKRSHDLLRVEANGVLVEPGGLCQIGSWDMCRHKMLLPGLDGVQRCAKVRFGLEASIAVSAEDSCPLDGLRVVCGVRAKSVLMP